MAVLLDGTPHTNGGRMSPAHRHFVAAVVLSAAMAAVTDMSPPTVEDTAAYVAEAVRRHHVVRQPRDDQERLWTVDVVRSECSIEKRTSDEVRVLGRWVPRVKVERWPLGEIDPASVHVTEAPFDGSRSHLVTVPCRDGRPCVEESQRGRGSSSHFEFTSDQIARRVAAAFRHMADLCAIAVPTPAAAAGTVPLASSAVWPPGWRR